jgi:hypothetical protein
LRAALKQYYPQVLEWFDDIDTPMFCDILTRWPTLLQAKRARKNTLTTFFHEHNMRFAHVLEQRLSAIKSAVALTLDAYKKHKAHHQGSRHLSNHRRWRPSPPNPAHSATNSPLTVFDLNDFDETLPGPFEWDVKRLAASITITGRNNGFSNKQCQGATRAAMRNYRHFIGHCSGLDPLDLYYYRFESDLALEHVRRHGKKHRRQLKEKLGKAARKNRLQAFRKLTDVVDGKRIIVPDPPLIERIEPELRESDDARASFE